MSQFWSQDKISAYLDGELSQAERVRVEQHLSENSADAETLREYLVLRGEFQKAPRFELDDQFPRRVLRAIADKQKAQTPPSALTNDTESSLPAKHLSTPQHQQSRQSSWRSAAAVMAALAATLMLSTFIAPQPRTRVGWDGADVASEFGDERISQLENQAALSVDSESNRNIGVEGQASNQASSQASAAGDPAKSISSAEAELRESDSRQANQAGESSRSPAPVEIREMVREKTVSPNRLQMQKENQLARPTTGRGIPNALNKPTAPTQSPRLMQENADAGIADAEPGMTDKFGQSIADNKQSKTKNESEAASDSEVQESQLKALADGQTGRYRRSAGVDVADLSAAVEEKDEMLRSDAKPGQRPIAVNQTAQLVAENVLHLRITPSRQNQFALDLLLRGQLDDPQVSKNLFARAELRDNVADDQILEQAPENMFKKMADLDTAGSTAQMDADKLGGYRPGDQSTDGRQTQFVQVFASEAEISQLLGQIGGEITRFELTPDQNDRAKTQPPALGRGGGGGFAGGGDTEAAAGAAVGGGNKASQNLNRQPAGQDGPALVQRFAPLEIELALGGRGVAADVNNRKRERQLAQDHAAAAGLEPETLKRDELQPEGGQLLDSPRDVRQNYWLFVEIVRPVSDIQGPTAESSRAVPEPADSSSGDGKDK